MRSIRFAMNSANCAFKPNSTVHYSITKCELPHLGADASATQPRPPLLYRAWGIERSAPSVGRNPSVTSSLGDRSDGVQELSPAPRTLGETGGLTAFSGTSWRVSRPPLSWEASTVTHWRMRSAGYARRSIVALTKNPPTLPRSFTSLSPLQSGSEGLPAYLGVAEKGRQVQRSYSVSNGGAAAAVALRG